MFLVYISNVYDNLPTDEVASIGGRPYQVQMRAYLPDATRPDRRAARFAADGCRTDRRLLRLGPALLAEACRGTFADPADAVALWRDIWEALRLRTVRAAGRAGRDQVAPR